MALPTSGPLYLSNIQTEFGGTNPINLSEYYAGGAFVPAGTTGTNGAVPTSGYITVSKFYGTSKLVPGQQAYTTAGSFTFTVPAGVTSISAVCVGGGGAGIIYAGSPRFIGTGGGGGGLAYKNNISVTPGENLTITVGAGGTPINANPSQAGGSSSIKRGVTSLCEASGGAGGVGTDGLSGVVAVSGGAVVVGDGGGSGGAASCIAQGASGGGGAGGYSGNGGNAGYLFTSQVNPTAGAGGGGGGGNRTSTSRGGSGGGGVGILGQGSDGAAAANETVGGGGGSSGNTGTGTTTANGGNGGAYGAGGGGIDNVSGSIGGTGGGGAVRIIWGNNRAFPSTNTGNL